MGDSPETIKLSHLNATILLKPLINFGYYLHFLLDNFKLIAKNNKSLRGWACFQDQEYSTFGDTRQFR